MEKIVMKFSVLFMRSSMSSPITLTVNTGVGGGMTYIPMSVLKQIGVTKVSWQLTGSLNGWCEIPNVASPLSNPHTFTSTELNSSEVFRVRILSGSDWSNSGTIIATLS